MKKAKYSADKVAKYFIYLSNKEHRGISNKKLQKILYYSQAWNLVFNDGPLFQEDIEAWVHGPAVRSIYTKYKRFGFNSIPFTGKSDEFSNLQEKELLNEIWRVYGKFDGDYLEILTHEEWPWREARGELEGHALSDAVISLETMKKFYSDKLKKSKNG